MNRVLALVSCSLLACSIASAAGGDVTAAQVNGTWKTKGGQFKIWALGGGKLQVAFSGTYEYDSPQGKTANEGEASGTAAIDGDTAIFKPEDTGEECVITLRFAGEKLIVTQQGFCGFGNNVRADGTYRKVSSKKPNFD